MSSGVVSCMSFSNGFVVDKPGFYQSPVNILEKHIGELSAASWTHRRLVRNKDLIQRDIFVGQLYTLASTLRRRRCSTATVISLVSNNGQPSGQNNGSTCIRSIGAICYLCLLGILSVV